MDYFTYIPSIKVFIYKTCYKAEYGNNIRHYLYQFPYNIPKGDEIIKHLYR
jgi:hypothetical protein